MGVVPDFESSSPEVDYVHRRADQADVYFIRNGGSAAQDFVGTFRVAGTPEVWDAVTGRIASEAHYETQDGRTRVPLHLNAYGSAFVVFSKPEDVRVVRVFKDGVEQHTRVEGDVRSGWRLPNSLPGAYALELSDGKKLNLQIGSAQQQDLPASQWQVSYQPGRGAPTGALALTAFRSWAESDDPGIRYFSGTATYTTRVRLSPGSGERISLRLTDLHEVCTVKVNGQEAGTIWAMPYVLDITKFAKRGENSIELDVTNLWPNRIIGDAQPSATERFTHTNIQKYTAASPLLPSGLIGPVVLETVPEAKTR
jgi:hypothetical protein